ncbi:SDR family NAD(P)-dependent oxidoreductase [Mycobacterium lehmannii]|uniref:SDR family NAD(P)-dependent oxidoreductase n=1 Tax=Mycobacterium lehmannii TaxID=2048550 RepID=UPI0018E9CE97|nr:SDR family NAD(P)-dependent oxidoreductase [Mycobacterium lehmannii]
MAKSRVMISGRTAVISGAGSGMGRSLAQRLSAHGSPVAISDINEQGLAETAANLSGPVLSRVLDVRDAQSQLSFAKEVSDWTPTKIGAVFNNAGVVLAATILDGDPADDEWLWDIDFRGVVNGTRAFLPILVEQDEGVIVNTSSVYGLAAMPVQSAYSAAKFAVRGFTDSLRHELRDTGVSAVCVFPGGVNTNIVQNARFREGPEGIGISREQMKADFAAISLTQPDKAAEIIHHGVEAGKARILVGPDAYAIDLLARITPAHYMDVMIKFQWVADKSLRLLNRIRAGLSTA